MRIGIVSTYPPIECGIGTYSHYLTTALRQRGEEVYVFSQYGGKGDYVFGSYSSKSSNIGANIFEMASKMTPDVLHIQHEFGLYGEPKGIQIIELILRCRIAGLPVLTTFHTVREQLTHEQGVVLRIIVQESKAIIVHGEYDKKNLSEYFGYNDKIYVIPHGVREVTGINNAKKELGVEGKKVLLLCGYLRETKRFDRVIKVFPNVVKAVNDVVLVMASKSRSVDHPEYQKNLYRMIEESPVSDKIEVLHGQFPQHIFDTILSVADVVALPYELGAQSGIMAHCFAFRKPVVTSGLRAFKDWIEASQGGLVANSDEELEAHIIRLLSDDEYRKSLSQNIAKFVKEKVAWRIVAEQHMNIYEKCAWRPTPRSRYFG